VKLVSIVVPCYNEQEVLPLFYDEIIKVTLLNLDFAKPASLAAGVETIRELIRYNKELGEAGTTQEPPQSE